MNNVNSVDQGREKGEDNGTVLEMDQDVMRQGSPS